MKLLSPAKGTRKAFAIVILIILSKAGLCQHTTTREKLDELLRAYANANLFNGSAFVEQKGQVILDKGYGFSDVAKKKMNSPNSKYQIYSITKSITATLILKLVEEKKVNLNDPLSKFYPSFPKGNQITIEHLLTHTSGIYNYQNDFTMPVESEYSIINFLKDKPLDFSPGSKWNYSNTGYFLLGFIIEKLTGMSYEAAAKKYILAPAGMHQSGFDYKNLNDLQKTKGYRYIYSDKYKEAPVWDHHELFSAGGMYSTTGDLYKFHKAMQANKILPESLSRKAYTIFKNNYGYGWFVDSISAQKIVSHSGGATGFRSYLIRDIDSDICVVLICNTENSDVAAVKKNILNIVFNQPYKLPKQATVSVSQIMRYEGTYSLNPDIAIYIVFENGRLTATLSGQHTSPLLYEGNDRFYIGEIDGYLSFKKGRFDSYDTLRLNQQGKVYTATKINARWGITGSATPNGWKGPDNSFARDSLNKNIWTAKDVKLLDGEFKFRLNSDWTYNFGRDSKGDLQRDGQNIKIGSGVYDIRLDLSNMDEPKFTLKKQNENHS